MLRFALRAKSGRRGVAALAAVAFVVQLLLPRQALAWDEQTHDWIADWAFQVMKLVEYENDPAHLQLPMLQVAGVPNVKITTPTTTCTGACADNLNDLIQHLVGARKKYGQLPLGPASVNADDDQSADLVCAEAVTHNPKTGRRLVDLDPAPGTPPQALNGNTPATGETNAQHCGFSHYDEGGLYSSPELTQMPGRLIGATLGFAAQAADARLHDWNVKVNVEGLILSVGGWLATFGTVSDSNTFNLVLEASQDVRFAASLVLTLFLAIIFEIAHGFSSDAGPALDDAWHAAQRITHLDQDFFSVLASPAQNALTSPTTYVGLGHFVNVQTPRTTRMYGTVPSNEFDDQQGDYSDESFFDAGTDSNGDPIYSQDDFDHYLQDVQSVTSPYVDPDSGGVKSYQLVGGAGDGMAASKDRATLSGQPDDEYWWGHELHEIAFTPLDNLAYRGFEQFRTDSCKHVETLHRTLHAFGDAACPLHTIGTTGQGHVPFEQSVDMLPGHWDAIRYFKGPSWVTSSQLLQSQHDQARRILEGAARWAGMIRAFRQNQPGGMPIRQLVTEEARTTLDILRNQIPKITCDRDACVFGVGPCTPPTSDESASCEQVIRCDGQCQGFVTDPDVLNTQAAPTATQTADPSDDSQPCSLLPGGTYRKCKAEAYVAAALSTKELAGVAYPATLALGLSEMNEDGQEAFARGYFRNYRASQRMLLEHAVSVTLAFLAYAADMIPATIPDSCLCMSDVTTFCQNDLGCHDLSSDHEACGSCGVVCGDNEACASGACTPLCGAPYMQCGAECADPRSDVNNCGICGNACLGYGSLCEQGQCVSSIGPD